MKLRRPVRFPAQQFVVRQNVGERCDPAPNGGVRHRHIEETATGILSTLSLGRTVRYAVVGLGDITQEAMLRGIVYTGNSELVALITGDAEKASSTGSTLITATTSSASCCAPARSTPFRTYSGRAGVGPAGLFRAGCVRPSRAR